MPSNLLRLQVFLLVFVFLPPPPTSPLLLMLLLLPLKNRRFNIKRIECCNATRIIQNEKQKQKQKFKKKNQTTDDESRIVNTFTITHIDKNVFAIVQWQKWYCHGVSTQHSAYDTKAKTSCCAFLLLLVVFCSFFCIEQALNAWVCIIILTILFTAKAIS